MSGTADLTAEQACALLHLEPHPTCGFVAETYRSTTRIAPGGLDVPFDGGRPIGTALLFLVTPDVPVHPHRIVNDQLYLHHLGDTLEVLVLHADGSHVVERVGPDIAGGEHLQLLIPGGTFHTARLAAGGRWHLGGSTEWPGVEPEDVEPGDIPALSAGYPVLPDFLAGR